MRTTAMIAMLLLAGCSKQGQQGSTSEGTRASATGSENAASQTGASSESAAADSSAYRSVTTYGSPTSGGAGTGGTGSMATGDAGTRSTGTTNQGAMAQGSRSQQGTQDVDVEAIRSLLIREYPNSADAIRAMTISEDQGIVTLRGLVQDERARPRIVALIERMPGVRGVNDETRSRSGQSSQ